MGRRILLLFLALILAVFLVSSCETTGLKIEPYTYEVGDHEGPSA
jgi:hypothetical protein